MKTLKVMGSGSSGNCYSLKVDNEILILDAGYPYKDILRFIDYDIGNVVGCLVTHEHKDHSKAVKDLLKNSIDVYSSKETFEELGIKHHRARSVRPLESFAVGGYTIIPFDVEHDAVNPLGYFIHHVKMGTLLYITDTYFVKYKFKANYMLLECNYCKKIINETLADKLFLRNRIVRSHFELSNVIDFLKANDLSELKMLMLIHLSGGNSDKDYFKEEVAKQTGQYARIAEKNTVIYL